MRPRLSCEQVVHFFDEVLVDDRDFDMVVRALDRELEREEVVRAHDGASRRSKEMSNAAVRIARTLSDGLVRNDTLSKLERERR